MAEMIFDQTRLHVGCYTPDSPSPAGGIVSFALDPDGLLQSEPVVTAAANPTFLAHAGGILYTTHEHATGRVSSYRLDDRLAPLSSTSSGGDGPAHVAVGADGRRLMVVNYTAGSAASIATDDQGRLGTPGTWSAAGSGPHPVRQQRPHPHQAVELPNGNWLVADLGTDVIAELTITTSVGLACVARHRLPPGTGPRHLVARSSWLYVAGELDSRVHGLSQRDDGYQWQWSLPSYDPEQSIACDTNDPSHIQLSADRTHLYVANRGRDTIGVFAVGLDGGIDLVQERATEGHWPRHFTVHGDRLYVANQLSHRVCVFAVQHAVIGELLQSVDIASPACVLVA